MNTDSPINHPCPHCFAMRGDQCLEVEPEFHLARRAVRMAALAAASGHPRRTAYVRGNLNHGDITQGHRRTYIDRPDPQLPFGEVRPVSELTLEDVEDYPEDNEVRMMVTSLEAYKEAVRRAVDAIFESHDSEGVR